MSDGLYDKRYGMFPGPWADEARCLEVDPTLWFWEPPEPGAPKKRYDELSTNNQAKLICGRCPVQAQCLEYAVTNGERFGVWGGTLPRERAQLRAKRKRTA